MDSKHRPEPDFVSRLEWQLVSDYRREGRFSQSQPRQRKRRFLLTAAVAVVSVFAGAVGAGAAERMEGSARKELLMARAQTGLELAQARLEVLLEMSKEIKSRVEAGAVDEHELAWMRLEMSQVESEARMAAFDLKQIEATGKSPRYDLAAPLVEGRDYVSARLQTELAHRTLRLELLISEVEQARENPAQDPRNVAAMAGQLAMAETEMNMLRSRLDLREEFIEGSLTSEEVEMRDRLLSAQSNLRHARKRLESISQEVRRVERARDAGLVPNLEALQARLQQKMAAAEARLAELELATLQSEVSQR